MSLPTTFFIGRGGAPVFTEFLFTNGGATGVSGPTLANLRSAYSPTEWNVNDTSVFNVTTQGYQDFLIPKDGTYRLRVRGAKGGDNTGQIASASVGYGGRGAEIDASFTLTEGSALRIIVGQAGLNESSSGGGGGGGGSFVFYGSSMTAFQLTNTYAQNNLLIAAGGGGGGTDDSQDDSTSNGVDARLGTNGATAQDGTNVAGSGGDGGSSPGGQWSGGSGAGVLGPGSEPRASGQNHGTAPSSYVFGFSGGRTIAFTGAQAYGSDGGFGGGGGASWGGAGGGGYSGGGADHSDGASSDKEGGGGGGSFKNTGFAGYILNTQGYHDDTNGSVRLQLL